MVLPTETASAPRFLIILNEYVDTDFLDVFQNRLLPKNEPARYHIYNKRQTFVKSYRYQLGFA